MELDLNALLHLSKNDFRVLTAVEMGMRNHEIVPAELVHRIAGLKHGGTYKVLRNLLKNKLVHHDAKKYDGYRLTYLGYDFLVRSVLERSQVATEDGTVLAMKLHRLGRTSFRAVKSKRDFFAHGRSFNWLHFSRLAALKEFAFMKALGHHGFPVPTAVECNRHYVIMPLVQGYPLVQVKELQNPDNVFDTTLGLVIRLVENGLIHCDFNEFNITFIDENAEGHDFCSDDDDSTSEREIQGGDAVAVEINSLEIADQHQTSSENKPKIDCTGDAMESLASGGNNDETPPSEGPGDEEEDDVVLTKQLNKFMT